MKIILAFLFIVILVSLSTAQSKEINIIPKPNLVEVRTGTFTLSLKTVIVASGPEDVAIAREAAEL